MKNLTRYLLTVIFLSVSCSKTLQPIGPPGATIVGWGDSLTFGYGGDGTTYLSALSKSTGIITINKGVRSEGSPQIKARMLSDTVLLKLPTIIWAGRNNVLDHKTVKKDIAAMVGALGHDHYLVLGIINGAYNGEHKGQSKYNVIVSLNTELAAVYGNHFIDIREYLISRYNPANRRDVADHDEDIIPQTMRYDSLHMNALGYRIIADKVIENVNMLITQ
jgi:lysophospholipase L1-like esterase